MPLRVALATRAAVLTVGAVALLGLGIGPASAQPDPGSPLEVAAATARGVAFVDLEADAESRPAQCVLLRVGTQFVACDFLTGNGVPAPGWIPEL